MKKFYDRTRLEGPYLEEGDKVYLISRNLCIKRLSRKLNFYKIGPFKIDKKISENNYILALPSTMQLRTNVFYISLLEPVSKNVRFGKDIEVEDEEEEWDVKEILDLRIIKG
jgi:hypothetical protein